MDKSMIEKLNKSKLPIIPIDKNLEKYRGKVLFPEKLEKANEILKKSKLPKIAN
jgi:ATP/maltotriose-dependent transcriptional regulator MalT